MRRARTECVPVEAGGLIDTLSISPNTHRWNESWFGGAYWWEWPAAYPDGEPCGTGYDVYKKPASTVLKAYYLGNTNGSGIDSMGELGEGSSRVAVDHAALAAAAAGAPSAPHPIVLYNNGVANWTDWSYGATVDFNSSVSPFPSHRGSALVSIPAAAPGAFSLHSPGTAPVDLTGYTYLLMDVIVGNATFDVQALAARLCTCDACGPACATVLPALWLGLYASQPSVCTLATNWTASNQAAAQIAIPLSEMFAVGEGGGGGAAAVVGIVRLEVSTGSKVRLPTQVVSFHVDNVLFV